MNGPLLVTRHLRASYRRGLPIVHDISIDVSAGELVTLVGPNGAGKSTFMKALAGLVMIEGGSIHLDGREIAGRATHEIIAAGVGFVPQTGNVFASLSIEDNLIAGGHILPKQLLRERLAQAFERFPALAMHRRSAANVLSGGQRQMLAVARAMMTAPRLILLDEPTAGLAPKVVQEVLADLRALADRGVAVLMVEQNAKAALRISDMGYVLVEGRNHMAGTARELLDNEAIAEAFLGSRRKS